MKNLVVKTVLISLLLSMGMPAGMQAEFISNVKEKAKKIGKILPKQVKKVAFNLKKRCTHLMNSAHESIDNVSFDTLVATSKILDYMSALAFVLPISKLIKTSSKTVDQDPKLSTDLAKLARFLLASTVETAIHELGHKTVGNYFFPGRFEIEKIAPFPFGGVTSFDNEEIDFQKNNNGLKYIAMLAAGPVSGFLGSYGLAKACSANSYLDWAYYFRVSSFLSIINLLPISNQLDGYKIAKRLKKLELPYKKYFFVCYLAQLLMLKKILKLET